MNWTKNQLVGNSDRFDAKEGRKVGPSKITKHINNTFKEGELQEKSNVQNMHIANFDKRVKYYSHVRVVYITFAKVVPHQNVRTHFSFMKLIISPLSVSS